MNRSPLLALVVLIGCTNKSAPNPTAQNSEPPVKPIERQVRDSSLTIEVIGLRRWTIAMIDDSLRRYVPGEDLASHACQANLMEKLHFVSASVSTFVVSEDTNQSLLKREHTTIVVAVREPGDSARVVQLTRQELDTSFVPAWKMFSTAYQNPKLTPAIHGAALEFLTNPDSSVGGSSSSAPFLKFLVEHRSQTDFDTALDVLQHSPSATDRAIASLLLAHFPASDEARLALFQNAVESTYGDAEFSEKVLALLNSRYPRPLDWTPVVSMIHAVLDGSSLSAMGTVFSALTTSGAAVPSNAKRFLGGGVEMLTAYLESSEEGIREPAHKFLVALRGEDLGLNPAVWRKWVATL